MQMLTDPPDSTDSQALMHPASTHFRCSGWWASLAAAKLRTPQAACSPGANMQPRTLRWHEYVLCR